MQIGSLNRCSGMSWGGNQSRGAGLSFRSIPVTIQWQSSRCGEKLLLKTVASYRHPVFMNGQVKKETGFRTTSILKRNNLWDLQGSILNSHRRAAVQKNHTL